MGTRADFYVGRGKDAEWLGSFAWDGYPDGVDKDILEATDEKDYRTKVVGMFTERDDGTLPEHGWPWPWNDSNTTDYAYAFDDGKVWACPFGHGWFDPLKEQPDDVSGDVVFPDMTEKKNLTLGRRSGLLVIGSQGIVDED